ncbi:catalase family protein [Asticcacaulis solisilvae]|uniref:catalase family protein n=1 Tax=Asticcacaulis solisilvae TaxID=1217274 RepID=UPI003FD890F4
MLKAPVPYTSSVEEIEDDEAQLAADLAKTMLAISRKTYEDTHEGLRSVHAKSHALLTGRLSVKPDLPPDLAQGLFAAPGDYPVIMRFSTTPGDILPDAVSTPRGLALKVIGVKGPRLPGTQDATTQDFVMVNGPAFQAPNARAFLANLKLLAMTTDRGGSAKVALSKVLRATEGAIESMGGKSTTLRALGGHPATHPLSETYYSATPYLHGPYIAKFSVAPVSEDLTVHGHDHLDIDENPTAIREAMQDHFAIMGGEWELRVQLCTDLEAMPVENAARVWPENESPYVAVATVKVEPQTAWSEARSAAIDDGMSFSPWHGLEAHRPLGSVNRLRKSVYEASARARGEREHKAMTEPTDTRNLFTDEPEEAQVYYP